MDATPGTWSGTSAPPDLRETLLYYLEGEAGFGVAHLPAAVPQLEAAVDDGRETPGSLAPGADGAILERLKEQACDCTACPLHATRTKVVFGEGDPRAGLMFVGEAPGRDEDLSGRPFVGKAGQLLTRMIKAMGYDRSSVYIANTVKCRPPGNRTPAADEMAACARFLRAQIDAVAPRVIVALGAAAAHSLLERADGISSLRGAVYPYPRNARITVVPTFHPAYLLRNETDKLKAWHDLKLAMDLLGGTRG